MKWIYTPGPWEIEPPSMAGNSRLVVGAYSFGSIACVSLNGAPKHQASLSADNPYYQEQIPTMEANATLIAEAPKLLEALESVEWIYRDDIGKFVCPCCGAPKKHGHYQNCKIGYTIKKAKGEL